MDLKEYMNRIEIKYDEPYIQIPRKLIIELNAVLRKHESERYTDYAFSFLVLNGFLYKYAHYIDYENGDYLTLSDIKILLKYSPRNQNINKISKNHGGVLEHEALVEITRDIPIFINYEEKDIHTPTNTTNSLLETRKILRMSEVSTDIEDDIANGILRTLTHEVYIPDFMIDYPKKLGTLNDYRETVKISYREFRRFVLSPEMNLKDFLVYCYIKSSSDKDGNSTISHDRAKRGIGMSHVTFKKTTEKLEKLNIINIKDGINTERFKKQAKTYNLCTKFKNRMKL